MAGHSTVYVNARFLEEPLTGLQRWGREVLRELDEMLEEGAIDREAYRFVLLSPSTPDDLPDYRHLELRVQGPLRSHLWEQFVLPRAAKDGFLLNFKNTAPVRHRRMATVIHDFQVYAQPETHTFVFNKLYRHVLPRAAKRSKAYMVVSQSTARESEKWIGVTPDAVTGGGHDHILRAGRAPELLKKHGLSKDGFLLGVSSLTPNKNFAAFLRAAQLAGLDLPVVIAGGTNPAIFAGSGEAALPDNAIYLGRVDDAELRTLYENARAFCFPSLYEGWGLPPGEAMLLGCPVVASKTTSIPEVCGDAVVYCDPVNDASIADALTQVCSDDALRARLREAGPLQSARFTWRRVAETMWATVAPQIAAD